MKVTKPQCRMCGTEGRSLQLYERMLICGPCALEDSVGMQFANRKSDYTSGLYDGMFGDPLGGR